MDVRDQNEEQTRLWNAAGCAWVEAQETVDRMFKPFEDLLVDAVAAKRGSRVLDVGCGTGGTTLAVARLLGANGRSTGIDISEPMVAAARARAEREGSPAVFVCADAQTYPFEPASFDFSISRFGVMFFADPVRAFANLLRGASKGAEVRYIAWRSPAENPFMTTAERAAAPLLPALPPRRPNEPGQFALADPDRVRAILDESGWTAVDIQPIDVACTLPEKGLLHYLSRFGPVGRVLHDVDESTRTRVIETVRAAFEPFVHGGDAHYTAACWMIAARA
jgi:SAM-dependent methyltransferase